MTPKRAVVLTDRIETGADADLLRAMIAEIVQQIVAAGVENLCNTAYGERSAERVNRPNGYREPLRETGAESIPVGTLHPAVSRAAQDRRRNPGAAIRETDV